MSTDQIKTLIGQRGAVKGQLTRFNTFFSTISVDQIEELEFRLHKIEPLIDKFNEIQCSLELVRDDSSDEAERSSFELDFYRLFAAARLYISNNKVKTESNSPFTHTHIKLPTIELPTFTGSYDEWLDFSDTFKSLVDNDSQLPNIVKFRYLKSCLKGEAANVIQRLQVCEDNYRTAWDLLKERYDNKSFIAKCHVNALFNVNTLQKESHVQLRHAVDAVTKHVKALESLQYNHGELILVFLIVSKLDPSTRRHWENSQKGNEVPTLNELMAFLQKHCKMLESLNLSKDSQGGGSLNISRQNKSELKAKSFVAINKSCPYCKQLHSIFNCNKFLALKIQDRIGEIKKLHLCINCLRGNHYVKDCKSSRCKQCNGLHNTLLHINQVKFEEKHSFENNKGNNLSNNADQLVTNQDQIKSISTHTLNNNFSEVLLATAVVRIHDKFNNPHNIRVLLGNGSQMNFITKACCDKLNLVPTKVEALVSGINQATTNINCQVEVTLNSLKNNYKLTTNCFVLPEITQKIPLASFDKNCLDIPRNIGLADANFNKASEIDMLLGASVFYNFLCVGQIILGKNLPVLQKTVFGWVISGPLFLSNNTTTTSLVHHSLNKTLLTEISKFWELEEIEPHNKTSPDNEFCENHFINNTTRAPDGQFIVKIPFRENVLELGESKGLALKRFYSIEKKLNQNPSLKQQYVNFMNEYENLGHMTKVNSATSIDSLQYFLPHHPVLRESSITTKLRVVFDGSARTTSGLSLNQVQHVGPTIQQDLFSIILRFRKHNIAISADISKMYRQVLVDKSHRNYQKIFWRQESNRPIDCYELNTVTYGTASAPFLAIRCLSQLAIENQNDNPEISNLIHNEFYVDDLLTGSESLEEALTIHRGVTKILNSGKFQLCKWSSNNKQFLNIISSENSYNNVVYVCDDPKLKTLGLTWNSHDDTIQYSVNQVCTKERVTKRSILSAIAQIYDPLGLLAPITIVAKKIMQELWKLGATWDESVPTNILSKWIKFVTDLKNINNLHIPRHALCKSPVRIELHGFCDASISAYGACVFIKSTSESSIAFTNLLCAKSRVAPLRSTTLPRLELCGALVLAQLMDKIINTLNIKFDQIFYWCDSTIVLNWINSPSTKWQTFVANRVSQIQDLCDTSKWQHVYSNDNSADLLTRGLSAEELSHCQLWWKGPLWLRNNHASSYSKFANSFMGSNDMPEIKREKIVLVATIQFDLFNKYSSLTLLLRVTAYILRFITNSKSNLSERKLGPLSSIELKLALKTLVKIAQLESFKKEFHILGSNDHNSINTKLVKLSPFLDEDNLIRVGGRLQNSEVTYDTKHPLLLPEKHALTTLVFKHEHEKLLHCGPQMLLSSIRETFWPISGRNLARKIVHSCVKCFRANPKHSNQMMGSLPKPRITPSSPFSHCGVDYAGPFYLKDRKTRAAKIIKTYICLFICFSTKAIHLELVGDLSAESFIAALRRFCARRGKPVSMYSDNGTNFVKANKELKELVTILNAQHSKDQIINAMNNEGIQWNFIPPSAPHFGGLWEAGVKGVKIHLARIFKSASLIYEDFLTILTQIEAILNSRPLCPLSADPNDLKSLTPGHFLIGKPLTAPPDINVLNIQENRLSKFQRIQALVQNYWRRWSIEYITELQEKTKWFKLKSNIEIDSMVIIKDETQPPLNWKLGRVVQLHPGSDGLVRVLSVKTQNGVIKRPIAKVCVLPVH